MSKRLKLVGMDPGTVYVGLCQLFMQGRRFLPFREGDVEVVTCPEFERLIGLVSSRLNELLRPVERCDVVLVLEKAIPPAARAPQWELTAQVRGAARVLAHNAGVKVFEIAANSVRAALGVSAPSRDSKLLRNINGPAFRESTDARVRRQFCLWSGLPEEMFKGKLGSHKVDALAAAYAVGLREFHAYNERLV